MTTVSRIARWRYVPSKQDEVDHMAECPVCKHPCRVRLGPRLLEIEQFTCKHFLDYAYKRELGIVEFRFGYSHE